MNRKAERLLLVASRLLPGAVIVEIGCVRSPIEEPSDGYSTVYLAEAARERGWLFYSVDRDAKAVENARNLTGGLGVSLFVSDGEKWLGRSKQQIDMLYLDGSSSPGEALFQYRAATLNEGATVVIDDVQPIGNHTLGKGSALLQALADDGFDVEIHETEPGYLMAVASQ